MSHDSENTEAIYRYAPKKGNDDFLTTDPMDYGMIRYTDLEVANHSILIHNLPKNIPNKEL